MKQIISPRLTELDGTPVQLDLSAVRAHMKTMHPGHKIPRSNAHVASAHARIHHRYRAGTNHHHEGDRRRIKIHGLPVEQEMNEYTGLGVVTREEAKARFLARQSGS